MAAHGPLGSGKAGARLRKASCASGSISPRVFGHQNAASHLQAAPWLKASGCMKAAHFIFSSLNSLGLTNFRISRKEEGIGGRERGRDAFFQPLYSKCVLSRGLPVCPGPGTLTHPPLGEHLCIPQLSPINAPSVLLGATPQAMWAPLASLYPSITQAYPSVSSSPLAGPLRAESK